MGLPYIDIHTHRLVQKPGVVAVYNVLAGKGESLLSDGWRYFSAGLHPWHIDQEKVEEHLAEVEKLAVEQRCRAIGETGLDRLSDTPFTLQQDVFEKHLLIARKCGKPVIMHCVRAHNEVVAIYRKSNAQVPLIFHGFNNNRRIADQLLKEGFYCSFGKALLNPASNAAQMFPDFPFDRFFLETDDAEVTIEEVYHGAAGLRKIEIDELMEIVERNFNKIFGKWE